MCESIVRTQAQEQAETDVFDLLRKALETLETTDEANAYSVSVAMRCRLAEVMGFGLQFVPPMDQPAVFIDITDGSILTAGMGVQMSRPAYQAMYSSRRGHWTAVSDADRLEIESTLSLYFSHHLERRIVAQSYSSLR
jgi:hypothetical protein